VSDVLQDENPFFSLGVLMLGLVGGLSAPPAEQPRLFSLQNSWLAELAAQQTQGILLIRLEESWKTGASDRRLGRPPSQQIRPCHFSSKTAWRKAPSLVEISIAGDGNRILVSSTRSNSGSPLREYQSLARALALGPVQRIRRVFARGPDYVSHPIGLLDDPHPIFTIQVLVSTVLLRDSLQPGLQWIGAASVSALFGLAFMHFVARRIRLAQPSPCRRGHRPRSVTARLSPSSTPSPPRGVRRRPIQAQSAGRGSARHRAHSRRFRNRMSAVLERLEEGILLFDPEQRLILFGGASERLLGRPLDGFLVSPTSPRSDDPGSVEQRRGGARASHRLDGRRRLDASASRAGLLPGRAGAHSPARPRRAPPDRISNGTACAP